MLVAHLFQCKLLMHFDFIMVMIYYSYSVYSQ